MHRALLLLIAVSCSVTSSEAQIVREGRLLSFDGSPVQLRGYGFYAPVHEVQFDFVRYLDALDRAGLNFTRVWLQYHWTKSLSPFRTVSRSGRYNLRRYDRVLFERLRDFLEAARDRGLFVQLTLFDGVALDDRGNRWPYSRLNRDNNVNPYLATPGEFDDRGRFRREVVLPLVDHTLSYTGDLPNVIYEVGNELYSHQIDRSFRFHEAVIARLRTGLQGYPSSGSKLISVNVEDRSMRSWALRHRDIDVVSFHVHDLRQVDDYRNLSRPVIISNDGDISQQTARFGGLPRSRRRNRIERFVRRALRGAEFGHHHVEILDKGFHGSSWTSLNYEPRFRFFNSKLASTVANTN